MNSLRDQMTTDCAKQGEPSWVQSAIVPMAMMTFAMFLLDIMQRLYPYNMDYVSSMFRKERNLKPKENRWKNMRPPTETTPTPANNEPNEVSIKIGSLFGKRYDRVAELSQKRRKRKQFGYRNMNLNPYEENLQVILNSIERPV